MTFAAVGPVGPPRPSNSTGPNGGGGGGGGAASSAHAGATAPPLRKRRRRTATGGASDDCFTCRKRSVKCDRKRPYCTPCIDNGKECSGYKTTLTWGVGVASRGKLRGLSCPIVDDPENGTGAFVPTETEGGRRRKSSVPKRKRAEQETRGPSRGQPPGPPVGAGVQERTEPTQAPATPTLPLPIPQPRSSWQLPGPTDHVQSRRSDFVRHSSFDPSPLQNIRTSLRSQYDFNMPSSALSVGSYSGTEYYSPVEYPQTPESLPFSDCIPLGRYVDQQQHTSVGSVGSYAMSDATMDFYDDPVNASVTSVTSNPVFPDNDAANSYPSAPHPMDNMYFSSAAIRQPTSDPFGSGLHDAEPDEDENTLALADFRFGSPFFHISPRMQSLMEYYDRNICPFLVAFDGPENPYRRHILQLALNNECLQNAIAALSTNNLRMRKKGPRQIGFAEEMTDPYSTNSTSSAFENSEPTAEEVMYKQLSIDQLNAQLASATTAQDDAVLATLLVLCLFHVCDSGFSKFKTQLAGVQKLLSLRDSRPSSPSDPNRIPDWSDFARWVEMFFTWFDVMTSTVNDREVQIQMESLDMLDFSADLGALEQFSGCDGRLFKMIARLGRLNLLAQGRPVKKARGPARAGPARMATMTRPIMRKTLSLDARDYDNIDGNGWGTPIMSPNESEEGAEEEEEENQEPSLRQEFPDERTEFWIEWHDLRKRLQDWQMSAPSTAANTTTSAAELAAGDIDLRHINESFRYSALLYVTRLANPMLPSSHPSFQSLVSQALDHIAPLEITSCVNKFLLWPLFMIGTECVYEDQRSIVRQRCVEIQRESGFFNNISGLEVLERVWTEFPAHGSWNITGEEGHELEVLARRRSMDRGNARWGQAFRWRRAMDRVDGEYIMI